MPESSYRVVRAFNNNVILARHDDDECVLVGRGLGFRANPGDTIAADAVSQKYMAVDTEAKARYLALVNSVDNSLLHAISEAIDRAADMLGELDPTLYIVLTDHLVFAVRRMNEGIPIRNPLLNEIRAVFPEESAAAELVLATITSQLGIELPEDEASFITLHLNAARRGASVKIPLNESNLVSEVVNWLEDILPVPIDKNGEHFTQLVGELFHLTRRIGAGRIRRFPATDAIVRTMPEEFTWAERVVTALVERHIPSAAGRSLDDEIAYLAVFLRGWVDDVRYEASKK